MTSLAITLAAPMANAEVEPPHPWSVLLSVPTACQGAGESEACVYSYDNGGTYRTFGAGVNGPVWARAHLDEINGWAGTSTVYLVEAGTDYYWVYWGGGWTDIGPDGTIDTWCFVCGGAVDENGYLVSQRLAYDWTGAEAVLGVRHDGSLRGVHAGVYDGQPYAHVVLV